jgi:hypothetical protein
MGSMDGLRLDDLNAHRPMSAGHELADAPKPGKALGFFSPQVQSKRPPQWGKAPAQVERENQASSVASPKRRSMNAWEEKQVLLSALTNQDSNRASNVSSPKEGMSSLTKPGLQRSQSMRAGGEAGASKTADRPDSATVMRQRRGSLESFSPRTQMELLDHPLGEFLLPILPSSIDEEGSGRLPVRTSNVKHHYGVATKKRVSYQGAPVAAVLPVKQPPSLTYFLESASLPKPSEPPAEEADTVMSKDRIAERRQSYAGLGLRDTGSTKRQGGRLSVKVTSSPRRASEGRPQENSDPSAFANRIPYQIKPRQIWTLEDSFRTVREAGEECSVGDFPTEGEARWLGPQSGFEWRPCMVLGYNTSEHRYWVQWIAPRPGDGAAGASRRFQAARMNVRFPTGESSGRQQAERKSLRLKDGLGGLEGRLGKLCSGEVRGDVVLGSGRKDAGGVAAILAELAKEYVAEARQLAAHGEEGDNGKSCVRKSRACQKTFGYGALDWIV